MARFGPVLRGGILGALMALAACATPAPMLTADVAQVKAGVVAAKEQSRLSFDAANRMATGVSIEKKLLCTPPASGSPAPGCTPLTISEADFLTAVPPGAAAKWFVAFDGLKSYLDGVQTLVDPDRAAATGDTLASIGNQLNGEPFRAGLPGPLVGVFSTLAQAIVQASAEKEALAVMRRVDPDFRKVTTAMAETIGDKGEGLLGTTGAMWDNRMVNINTAYAQAVTDKAPDPVRRALLSDFAEALAGKRADAARLQTLQQSLAALAELHSAAARGDRGTAQFWLSRIEGWLDDIQRRAAEADASGK